MIIGGLIGDSNFTKFPSDKRIKIDIYRYVIEEIKKKHGLKPRSIWYLRHPRLPYNNWQNLKKNLDCSFYRFNDLRIAEIILCNPNISAVYSVSSTALYHASEILKIDSYVINILSLSKFLHPSSYRLDAETLKKVGVTKELIVNKSIIKTKLGA